MLPSRLPPPRPPRNDIPPKVACFSTTLLTPSEPKSLYLRVEPGTRNVSWKTKLGTIAGRIYWIKKKKKTNKFLKMKKDIAREKNVHKRLFKFFSNVAVTWDATDTQIYNTVYKVFNLFSIISRAASVITLFKGSRKWHSSFFLRSNASSKRTILMSQPICFVYWPSNIHVYFVLILSLCFLSTVASLTDIKIMLIH